MPIRKTAFARLRSAVVMGMITGSAALTASTVGCTEEPVTEEAGSGEAGCGVEIDENGEMGCAGQPTPYDDLPINTPEELKGGIDEPVETEEPTESPQPSESDTPETP